LECPLGCEELRLASASRMRSHLLAFHGCEQRFWCVHDRQEVVVAEDFFDKDVYVTKNVSLD
jgi:hypothetical protein